MSEIFKDKTAVLSASLPGNGTTMTTITFTCERKKRRGCAENRRDCLVTALNSATAGNLPLGYGGYCRQGEEYSSRGDKTPISCPYDGSRGTFSPLIPNALSLSIGPSEGRILARAGITIEAGNSTGVVVNMADKEEQT